MIPTPFVWVLLIHPFATSASQYRFNLGGLFPIHADDIKSKVPCTLLLKNKGIQRLEAMFYALDKINSDNEFRDIFLNATILDTCSSDSHVLEQSLDLLKVSDCGKDTSDSGRVTAVIGAANSPVSASVANILRLFKIPQVSYASTSAELDDVQKFPYFFRVVPSDIFQVEVIINLINHFKWTYISAVVAKGEYGEKAIQLLEDRMKNSTLEETCFATIEILQRNTTTESYEAVVERLLSYYAARAVVVFLNEEKLRNLLNAASSNPRARSHFLWIGSDSWGTKFQPIEKLEATAEGAITILPKTYPISGFDDYFLSLTPGTNSRNEWFKEYWKLLFNCVTKEDEIHPLPRRKFCTDRDNLKLHYRQEGLVPMVIDSVYTVAYALRAMCKDKPRVCEKWNEHPDGALLTQYIKNATFNSSQGHNMVIKFDENRHIPINYTIYQFRKLNKPGRMYDYIEIGDWNLDSRLQLQERTKWRQNKSLVSEINSSCSLPCPAGQERVMLHNKHCCWTCQHCEELTYLPNPYVRCIKCPKGLVPNAEHTACEDLKSYLGSEWTTVWTLVPFLFACLGVSCTLVSGGVYFAYRTTPIIKASGRELCYVILGGILLCYSFTFVAIIKPNETSCGILRVNLNLGLAMCYSAIFTKTNRISRLFNRRLSTNKRPAYISPRSQLVIVLFLVLIQLMISILWIIIEVPTVTINSSAKYKMSFITCGIEYTSVLIGMLYNILLIILCTVYAFKTRNIPENFNEAKFISFTMYSTCIVWLAFIPTYSSTGDNYTVQSMTLCMTMSLSGTIPLVCIFFPKLYLVLLKPHKNVKFGTTTTPSNASGFDTTLPTVRYIKPVGNKNTLAPPSLASSHSSYRLSPSPKLSTTGEADC